MSDLISRKALLEELKTLERLARDRVADTPWDSPCRQRYQAQLFERERLKELVEKMPTAFDKEKIIEELDKLTGEECTLHECGIRSERCKPCIAKKAIEIVEKGGIG